jgi:hypothetical protein
VTEAEWNACSNPYLMLLFLRGKVSDRKLRLAAVAGCRTIWDRIPAAISRQAVDLSERFADGEATEKELERVRKAAYAVAQQHRGRDFRPLISAWNAARPAIYQGISLIVGTVSNRCLSGLFREVLGSTLHRVSATPRRSPTMVALAQTIYTDRAFDRLPILADALEDAGCTDAEILAHCRGPGPHVRGCWVVDLILGKE